MRLSIATPTAYNYACKKFHYAKAIPVVKVAFNVFNDEDEWCGVIIYGSGANCNIAIPYDKWQGQVLELVRVALNGRQKHGETSKAVGLSLKMLKKMYPWVDLIVSYADHRQKHLGIIYQATNWLYVGKTITSDTQYFYKGKWTHQRSIDSLKNKDYLKKTLLKRENSNKFKYIYCFDKKEREKYKKLALPYPQEKDLTTK